MKRVAIIDCEISNLNSVRNALDFLKIEAEVLNSAEDFEKFSHFILPGVGAFKQGIENLKTKGLDEAILKSVQKGRPLLGICLGMQLLATTGEEFGLSTGLNLIPGNVKKICLNSAKLRLPHVGWNDVFYPKKSRLWDGIEENSSFYFIHSYAYADISEENVVGACEYGGRIVSAVARENIFGVQFHPEKSQKDGLRMLENFLKIC